MGNSGTVAASLVGAVIGGIAGYLLFTDHGRTLRRQIEPAIDDLSRELDSFRSTVQKVVGVANEGWTMLNEAMGDEGQHPQRYPAPRQSSQF